MSSGRVPAIAMTSCAPRMFVRLVDGVGEPLPPLGILDDQEAPRLLVRCAAGDAPGVEDPRRRRPRESAVRVVAVVPLADDREIRVHRVTLIDPRARVRLIPVRWLGNPSPGADGALHRPGEGVRVLAGEVDAAERPAQRRLEAVDLARRVRDCRSLAPAVRVPGDGLAALVVRARARIDLLELVGDEQRTRSAAHGAEQDAVATRRVRRDEPPADVPGPSER